MRPINRSVKIQNGRPDCVPKRPKIKSFDGGNIVVFVLRCKCSATAIPCLPSIGGGNDATRRAYAI